MECISDLFKNSNLYKKKENFKGFVLYFIMGTSIVALFTIYNTYKLHQIERMIHSLQKNKSAN